MGEMIAGDPVAPLDIERKLRAKYALLGVHNIVLLAMSGIDVAAWDAHAQHLHQPLVRALGGTVHPVRAYNSKGLGIMPIGSLADNAEVLVKEGFSAVKVRLGRANAKDDLAAVRTVKKAIGPDITLMCDFNQALTVNEALLRGRMLDDEGGLHWIEEPTRADDFHGNARIADALDTPVQIGENFMGPEQMAQALAARASDFVMPDLQRIGGVTGWMRAAALAQGAGCEMSSHLFPEVSCHLLAVTPTCHWLEYVDWAAPVLVEPLAVKDSHVVTPSFPGNGIRWDERAVEKYAI
jgi:mandelate racemase